MNTRPDSEKEQAARVMQTAWRHRKIKTIFSNNNSPVHIKGSREIYQELPKPFRHLWDQILPPVLTQTQHRTSHLEEILYAGRLIPQIHTGTIGFTQPGDKKIYDDRLVCTSPMSSSVDSYGLHSALKFHYEKLMANKHVADSVYFKAYDWTCRMPIDLNTELTDQIKLQLRSRGNKAANWKFEITNQTTNKTYEALLPSTEFVYHGAKDLNQFLTFFVFKIINNLNDLETKESIYAHFQELDKQNKLIEHLQNITKKLIVYSELDFVNPITLDLEMISHIGKIDIAELKKSVMEDDIAKVKHLCTSLYESSYLVHSSFFGKEILALAKTFKAKQVEQFISEHFADALANAEHKVRDIPDDLPDVHTIVTAIKKELVKHERARNIIHSTPENSIEWDNIAKIQTICNKKYHDRLFYGNSALNRMILLDPDIATLLTKSTLQLLFALQTAQANYSKERQEELKIPTLLTKLQIKRGHNESTSIPDVIFFALADGTKVLKLMPNNEKDYSAKMYEIQKQNYELCTKEVIRRIYELASSYGINIFTFLKPKHRNYYTPPLSSKLEAIITRIEAIKKSGNKLALINVNGFSFSDIHSQCINGFLALCRHLMLTTKHEIISDTIIIEKVDSLNVFVKLILASPGVFLNGIVSHLFLDRAHLEAAILADTKIIFGANQFSFKEILKAIIKFTNNSHTLIQEQLDVRLRLVEAHLNEVAIKLPVPTVMPAPSKSSSTSLSLYETLLLRKFEEKFDGSKTQEKYPHYGLESQHLTPLSVSSYGQSLQSFNRDYSHTYNKSKLLLNRTNSSVIGVSKQISTDFNQLLKAVVDSDLAATSEILLKEKSILMHLDELDELSESDDKTTESDSSQNIIHRNTAPLLYGTSATHILFGSTQPKQNQNETTQEITLLTTPSPFPHVEPPD